VRYDVVAAAGLARREPESISWLSRRRSAQCRCNVSTLAATPAPAAQTLLLFAMVVFQYLRWSARNFCYVFLFFLREAAF